MSGADDDFVAYDNFGVPLPEPVLRKPGKRRASPEDGLHVTLKRLFSYGIASPGFVSSEGVLWMSHEVRNAGSEKKLPNGRTINLEAIGRKMRGVVAGVPDIQVVYRGRSYWLELKSATGRLSPAQVERHTALQAAGCEVAVVRDAREAVARLTAWQVPHRVGSV